MTSEIVQFVGDYVLVWVIVCAVMVFLGAIECAFNAYDRWRNR